MWCSRPTRVIWLRLCLWSGFIWTLAQSTAFKAKGDCCRNCVQCSVTNTCVPHKKLCDGTWDCKYGEDEHGNFCKNFLTKKCRKGQSRCQGRCQPWDTVCSTHCGEDVPNFSVCWAIITKKMDKKFVQLKLARRPSVGRDQFKQRSSSVKNKPSDPDPAKSPRLTVASKRSRVAEADSESSVSRTTSSVDGGPMEKFTAKSEKTSQRSKTTQFLSTPSRRQKVTSLASSSNNDRQFSQELLTRLNDKFKNKDNVFVLHYLGNGSSQPQSHSSFSTNQRTSTDFSTGFENFHRQPSLPSHWSEGPHVPSLPLIRDHAEQECCEHCVRCASSSSCIAHTQICDGVRDCFRGEDEAPSFCQLFNKGACPPGSAPCNTACLPWNQACRNMCNDRPDFEACFVIRTKQLDSKFIYAMTHRQPCDRDQSAAAVTTTTQISEISSVTPPSPLSTSAPSSTSPTPVSPPSSSPSTSVPITSTSTSTPSSQSFPISVSISSQPAQYAETETTGAGQVPSRNHSPVFLPAISGTLSDLKIDIPGRVNHRFTSSSTTTTALPNLELITVTQDPEDDATTTESTVVQNSTTKIALTGSEDYEKLVNTLSNIVTYATVNALYKTPLVNQSSAGVGTIAVESRNLTRHEQSDVHLDEQILPEQQDESTTTVPDKVDTNSTPSSEILDVVLLMDPAVNTSDTSTVSAVTYSVSPKDCPLLYSRIGGVCIAVLPFMMAWPAARSLCRSLSGRLMEFHNAAELEALSRHLFQTDAASQFWIGGLYNGTTDTWAWTSGLPMPMSTPYWAIMYSAECVTRESPSLGSLPGCYHYVQGPVHHQEGYCAALHFSFLYHISDQSCFEKKQVLCSHAPASRDTETEPVEP